MSEPHCESARGSRKKTAASIASSHAGRVLAGIDDMEVDIGVGGVRSGEISVERIEDIGCRPAAGMRADFYDFASEIADGYLKSKTERIAQKAGVDADCNRKQFYDLASEVAREMPEGQGATSSSCSKSPCARASTRSPTRSIEID